MLPLDSVQKKHFGPSIVTFTPPTRPTQSKISKRVPLHSQSTCLARFLRQVQPRSGCRARQEQTLESAHRTTLSPETCFQQQSDGHPIRFGILWERHDRCDCGTTWRHVASRALRYSVISSPLATIESPAPCAHLP